MTDIPITAPVPATPAHRAWEIWRGQGVAATDAHQRVTTLQDKPRSGVYRLHGAGPDGVDVIAKRGRREKIAAEHAIYAHWLAELPVSTVRCLEHTEDIDGDSAWLFLQFAGEAPYSHDSPEHRMLLARWLATLHTSFAHQDATQDLPDRGPRFYRQCLTNTCDALAAGLENPVIEDRHRRLMQSLLPFFQQLHGVFSRVEHVCIAMPWTLVHGDLLPKNIRVSAGSAATRLFVFDWEYAGWGPQLVDLVQSADLSDAWASPDLSTYHAAVHAAWPELSLEDLRRASSVARLLHILLWTQGDARNLSSDWVERPLIKLAAYQADIHRILQGLQWTP